MELEGVVVLPPSPPELEMGMVVVTVVRDPLDTEELWVEPDVPAVGRLLDFLLLKWARRVCGYATVEIRCMSSKSADPAKAGYVCASPCVENGEDNDAF